MSEKAIEQMPGKKEPSALDLLSGFKEHWLPAIEAAERDGFWSAGVRREYAYFEPELHRVIQAFVNEATKPWRDGYVDAVARQIPPGMLLVSKETLENLPPVGDQELWRSQVRGVWYRVIIEGGFRPRMQVSFNASLGGECEVWQTQ